MVSGAPARLSGSRLLSPLAVLCAAQFILQLDFSIVNLALRTIQEDLGFSASGLQWVATGYALTYGSLLLLGGRLGDAVGPRRLLLGGLAVFALASLACGLARSPELLVGFRFVQGAGAAMVGPSVLSMLTALHPQGRARTRALAIWAGSLAAGGTTGLMIGGLMTEYLGWRSIFLVNLPMVAILLPRVAALPDPRERTRTRLDWAGAGQVTLAIAALIFGLTSGEQYGFDSAVAIVSLLLAALLTFGFVLTERRAPEPMLPLGFFATAIRRTSVLTMFAVGGITAAYAYTIALCFQRVLGYSEAVTSLALVPSGVAMVLTSMFVAPRLIHRLGLKASLLIGVAAVALGQLLFADLGADSPYLARILVGLLINAFGMGLTFAAVGTGITHDVGAEQRGVAGGLIPAAQQVGSSVVLAVLATVAAAVTAAHDGDLMLGYRSAFLGAAAIAALIFVLIACTRFRDGVAVVAAPDRLAQAREGPS